MATRHLPNWLVGWCELFKESNFPDAYVVWSGVFTINAAMQNNVWFDRGARVIYPNLYLWIVGEPATGKSIPAEKAVDMLRMIPPPEGPLTIHSGELTKIHLLKSMQAAVLHKQVSMLTRKELTQTAVNPCIVLHCDELSADVGEADFAMMLLKHLVQMYAVPTHYQYGTDKHGLIDIEKPLINWIACTSQAWLNETIPHHLNDSGLTARINTITAPFPQNEDRDFKWNGGLWKTLFNDLVLISLLKGPFHLDQLGRDKRTELSRLAFERRARLRDDIERAQWGREGDQALKVAMALSASTRDDRIITEGVIDSAYRMVIDARNSSLDLYTGTSSKPHIQLKLDVLRTIKRHRAITRSRLSRMLSKQANSEEVNRAVIALVEEGFVEIKILPPQGTNIYYYIPQGDEEEEGN